MIGYTDKALKLFSQKFHCSQAVLAALGGGMCKGEVCGACTGALMALGLKYGQSEISDLDSRLKTNELTVKFLEKFCEENGSYICKELLGCDLSTCNGKEFAIKHNLFTEFCPKMVASAVRIAEELLNLK